jgi:hypothetical protein
MRPSTPKNGRGAARHAGLRSPHAPPTPASTPAAAKRGSGKATARPSRQSRLPMPGTAGPEGRFGADGPGLDHSRGPGLIRSVELSPQSSSESLASANSQPSQKSVAQASDDLEDQPQISRRSPSPVGYAEPTRIISYLAANIVIEELSDFDGSDIDRLNVIRPHLIEDADSERSRSRSRNPPEIEQSTLYRLGNLRCSDDDIEDSEQSDMDETTHFNFMEQMRRDRRQKRMSIGSIGKRTITESLGSDSDREDLRTTTTTVLDISEVGARRTRRRVGDRNSLQFQGPPMPVIEQMEEPATSDDDLAGAEALARELPYYTVESKESITMEIDSP